MKHFSLFFYVFSLRMHFALIGIFYKVKRLVAMPMLGCKKNFRNSKLKCDVQSYRAIKK